MTDRERQIFFLGPELAAFSPLPPPLFVGVPNLVRNARGR
jgi:hypothetical protein